MGVHIPRQQIHNGTHAGRNVPFMHDVAAVLGADAPLNILSFGCSTGEECVDFAAAFPNAVITGLEVNPEILAVAKRVEGPRVRILPSTADALTANGPYDVIFAMSVLCLSPETIGMDNIGKVYPFKQFNKMVSLLDRHLKPGGILGAYNAQYFIEETWAGKSYSPVQQPSYGAAGWIEKCEKSGRRVCTTTFTHSGVDYTWPEWDASPYRPMRKTGHYRQSFIPGRERPELRSDVALWQKPLRKVSYWDFANLMSSLFAK